MTGAETFWKLKNSSSLKRRKLRWGDCNATKVQHSGFSWSEDGSNQSLLHGSVGLVPPISLRMWQSPLGKALKARDRKQYILRFFFYFFLIIPSAKSSFQSLFQVRGRVEYAKSSQVGKPAIYSVPTLWLKTRHPTTSGAIGQGRRKPSYKIKKNEFLE